MKSKVSEFELASDGDLRVIKEKFFTAADSLNDVCESFYGYPWWELRTSPECAAFTARREMLQYLTRAGRCEEADAVYRMPSGKTDAEHISFLSELKEKFPDQRRWLSTLYEHG